MDSDREIPRRALAAPAWALLAIFIVYASAGTWTAAGPRLWAPAYISWPDAAQNVLTYLPFGILGVLSLGHRRHSLIARVIEVAVAATLFSLCVEVMQLYTEDRIASVIDVIAALAGATAGGFAAGPAARVADRAIGVLRPSGVLDAAGTPVLMVLLAAMTIAAWWPFDPTLDVSTLADRLRIVRRDPWQLTGASTAGQALLFTWLGLAIAASADRLRTVHATLAATAAAIVVALVLDAGQLAMGSTPIGLAGLGAQIAGAVAGSALFAAVRVPK